MGTECERVHESPVSNHTLPVGVCILRQSKGDGQSGHARRGLDLYCTVVQFSKYL